MELYRFDLDCKLVSRGASSLAQAMNILDECIQASGSRFQRGEEAVAATSFGLSRTEKDFIEIYCDSPAAISIHTDRLHFDSFVSRIFGSSFIWVTFSRTDAEGIIRDYFKLPRKSFEAKHAKWLR